MIREARIDTEWLNCMSAAEPQSGAFSDLATVLCSPITTPISGKEMLPVGRLSVKSGRVREPVLGGFDSLSSATL